jgi:hypothetical protein
MVSKIIELNELRRVRDNWTQMYDTAVVRENAVLGGHSLRK